MRLETQGQWFAHGISCVYSLTKRLGRNCVACPAGYRRQRSPASSIATDPAPCQSLVTVITRLLARSEPRCTGSSGSVSSVALESKRTLGFAPRAFSRAAVQPGRRGKHPDGNFPARTWTKCENVIDSHFLLERYSRVKRSLNALLLLLLLLTLPLRSIAAFTPLCEPIQHQDSVSAFHHGDTGEVPANQHDADSTSHGHHHEGSADLHSAACGVSCSGAMSGSIFDVALANVISVSRISAFVDHSYVGFIPDEPERPPRTVLC